MRDCDGTNDDEVRDILSILIGDLMGCQLNEVVAIAARSWSVSSHSLSFSLCVWRARTHALAAVRQAFTYNRNDGEHGTLAHVKVLWHLDLAC